MSKGRRSYYKQPSSVWRDQLTNDELAALVRLQAYLEDRWAREGLDDHEAGRATIGITVAMQITGKGRADVAAKSLGHLADVVSMSVERRGDVIVIDWPKFAEYQHNFGRFAREKGPPHPHPHPRTALEEKNPPGGASADALAAPPDCSEERLPPWRPDPPSSFELSPPADSAPKPKPPSKRKGKPKGRDSPLGQLAVKTYIDSYREKTGISTRPVPQDQKALREVAEAVGAELVVPTIEAFFAVADKWTRDKRWPVSALRRDWQVYRDAAIHAARDAEARARPDPVAALTREQREELAPL